MQVLQKERGTSKTRMNLFKVYKYLPNKREDIFLARVRAPTFTSQDPIALYTLECLLDAT